MKAIMISIKPKWCAKIMNGEKYIEVRKNKILANAIQKLIDEYGFADIYVCCSKDKKNQLYYRNCTISKNTDKENWKTITFEKEWFVPIATTRSNSRFNGKVVFKFRCYKVEEIEFYNKEIQKKSCLTENELFDYLFINTPYNEDMKIGYAIHISDLEIFDRPKELSEFFKIGFDKALKESLKAEPYIICSVRIGKQYQLTKAPQNFCYVEVE